MSMSCAASKSWDGSAAGKLPHPSAGNVTALLRSCKAPTAEYWVSPSATPSRCNRPQGSLGRRPAVDHEPGAGHKAGVVGGEKDDALGDVVGHAEPADRVPQ